MEKNEYSMKELAEKTGLSLSSISRALDPARAHLVKPKTRELIHHHVKAMNFSLNPAARRLKLNKSETITVVALRDPFKSKTFSSEFASHTIGNHDIQELAAAIKAHYYDMKLEFIDQDKLLDETIFDRHKTDGVIFSAYCGTEYQEILQKSQLPAVYMSRYIDISRRDVQLVGLNREPGFVQAVDHLLSEGRKKIGWIGIPRSFHRNSDILQKLLSAQGHFKPELFFEVRNYYDIRNLIHKNITEKLDAVFCSNDVIADWVIRELHFNGIAVPEDITVIGYDKDPTFQQPQSSKLSTIGTRENTMPHLAVKLLFEKINAGDIPENPQSIIVDSCFMKGQS